MAKKKKDRKIIVIFRKIIAIIANVLMVLLILVGIVVAVSVLPIRNNFKILSVMSGSMQPKIPVGSIVVIKPAQEYVVGNIVTFKNNSQRKKDDYTTHRIVDVQDASDSSKLYITKGDANDSNDSERVEPRRIIGKYLFQIKWLGYLLVYIKTLPGLILIIIIPSAIIVYEEFKKMHRETRELIKKRRKKKAKIIQPKIEKSTFKKKAVKHAKNH